MVYEAHQIVEVLSFNYILLSLMKQRSSLSYFFVEFVEAQCNDCLPNKLRSLLYVKEQVLSFKMILISTP